MKKIHNKAQGLSLHTIIIAVLALIVLVVLVLIFAGKTRLTSEQTKNVSAGYTTEKCVVPGTSRECTISCQGVDYGRLNCKIGTCCEK